MEGVKLSVGTAIWVPCKEQVWRSAEVIDVEDGSNGFKARIEDDSTVVSIKLHSDEQNASYHVRNVETYDSSGLSAPNDLTQLTHLHEAAVLNSLNVRFDVDIIYTFTGPILIAVNPFKSIPNMYGLESLSHFVENYECLQQDRIPHVFATASQAYRGLCRTGLSQTILISGESGAGKTESTKYVMKFLACAGADSVVHRSLIEQQVLESNPLLEAFGNARTLRNDNSSRFGKFIELQFQRSNEKAKVCGARIHTYLLEKVRVCDQQEGERDFHMFYQLAAATSSDRCVEGIYKFPSHPDLLKELNETQASITPVELDLSLFGSHDMFRYLTRSSRSHLDGVDDSLEFERTLRAVQTVGIPSSELVNIINVVGGLLFLGNVVFSTPQANSEGSAISSVCRESLEAAAKLLGLEMDDIPTGFCYRTIKTVREEYRKPLKVQEAEEMRDALARALYGCVFNAIVEKTNESIGYREDIKLFCGVLDIFGFECFLLNSFEQLCINFANERLQQFFNTFVFKCEETLYMSEGIEWNPLDFPDNQDCVDLLESKPHGLFCMIDEECIVPQGSDQTLNNKFCKTHSSNRRFEAIKTKPMWFTVKHFAGPVHYCSSNFLDKNKDQISLDVRGLIENSRNPFVANLFVKYMNKGLSSNEGGKKRKLVTVSSEFKDQLNSLMTTIQKTEPHFIRCIKPNPHNISDSFDRPSVTEQLRYGGVLQAVHVSRAGYPVRLSHRDVAVEYACLLDSEGVRKYQTALGTGHDTETWKEVAKYLMNKMLDSEVAYSKLGVKYHTWAVGKTMCFLKTETYELLQGNRAKTKNAAATQIQRVYLGWKGRMTYLYIQKQVRYIQAVSRGKLARTYVRKLRIEKSAVMINRIMRGFIVRNHVKKYYSKIYLIQFKYRRYKRRINQQLTKVHVSASLIQSVWRTRQYRKRFCDLRHGVVKAQLAWRRILAKRELKRMRQEAREVTGLLDRAQKLHGEIQEYKQLKVIADGQIDQLSTVNIELTRKVEVLENRVVVLNNELSEVTKRLEDQRNDNNNDEKQEVREIVPQHESANKPSKEENGTPSAASEKVLDEGTEVSGVGPITRRSYRGSSTSGAFDSTRIVEDNARLEELVSKKTEMLTDKTKEIDELKDKYNNALNDISNLIPMLKRNNNAETKKNGSFDRWLDIMLVGGSKVGKTSLLEGVLKQIGDEKHLLMLQNIKKEELDDTVPRAIRIYDINYNNVAIRIVDSPDLSDKSIKSNPSLYENAISHLSMSEYVLVIYDPDDNTSISPAIDLLKLAIEHYCQPVLVANTYPMVVSGEKDTSELMVKLIREGKDLAYSHNSKFRSTHLLSVVLDQLLPFIADKKNLELNEIKPIHDHNNSNLMTKRNNKIDDNTKNNRHLIPKPSGGLNQNNPPPYNSNTSELYDGSSTGKSVMTSMMDTMKTWFGPSHKASSNSTRGSAPLNELLRPSLKGASSQASHGSKSELAPSHELQDQEMAITCLAFGQEKLHRDYYLLACAAKDGHVVIYRCYRTAMECALLNSKEFTDLKNEESGASVFRDNLIEVHTRLHGHSRAVTSMFFSLLEDQLITTSIDKSIRFWMVSTGDMVKVFTDSSSALVAAFLPFNPTVFIASNSNSVLRLVSVKSGEVLQKLKVECEVRALKFDDTGLFCLAGTKKGTIHVLEATDSSAIRFRFKETLAKGAITCITFVSSTSPNTPPCILVNSCDSLVTIIDCIYGPPSGVLTNLSVRHRVRVTHSLLPLRCSSSMYGGGWLVTPSEDQNIYAVSLARGSQYRTFCYSAHQAPVLAVAVNAQDTLMVSADSLGKLIMWRRFDLTHL